MGKNHLKLSSAAALAALTLGLAACSDVSHTSFATQPSLPNVSKTIPQSKTAQGGSLYITSYSPAPHGSVVVYGTKALKYVRSITSGVGIPVAIAFNTQKQLFVANGENDTVTVYKAHGGSPIRTLSNRLLKGTNLMAISSQNDVYVAGGRYINIFVGGRQNQVKLIHTPSTAMTFDSSDDLYVGLVGTINVYGPNAIHPKMKITEGVGDVTKLATDAAGNLYSANYAAGGCGNVTEYNAATGALENTITKGVCEPLSVAVDSLGNLYVGNEGNSSVPSSVTVYAVGTGALSETITEGIEKPRAMIFDQSNNLYVANETTAASTVTMYPFGKTVPSRTLSKGIRSPLDLAWLQ
jgi:hypothetical protein